MLRSIVLSTLLVFVLAQEQPAVPNDGEVQPVPEPAKADVEVELAGTAASIIETATNLPSVILKSYGAPAPIAIPAYAPAAPISYIPRFPAYPYYRHRHHGSWSDSDSHESSRKCDQCKKLRASCDDKDGDCVEPEILHFEHKGCKKAVVSCGSEAYQLFNEDDELIGASENGDFLFSCKKRHWKNGDGFGKKVYCMMVKA